MITKKQALVLFITITAVGLNIAFWRFSEPTTDIDRRIQDIERKQNVIIQLLKDVNVESPPDNELNYSEGGSQYMALLRDALSKIYISPDGTDRLSVDEQTKILTALVPFFDDQPISPIKRHTRPTPLREVNCDNYPTILGEKRKNPSKYMI